MKRKIACALSVVAMTAMLGACGTDPTTVDYNGHSYSDLSSETLTQAFYTGALSQYRTEMLMNGQTEFSEEEKDYLVQSGVSEYIFDSLDKWDEIQIEFGTDIKILPSEDTKQVSLMEIDPTTFNAEDFTVTKSGETLTTDVILTFGERNVDFQLVYDYFTMDITGVTIEPVYTVGEKMAKAGLNTVISLSIVFAVLILISLIISCFNIFPYLEKKKKERAERIANTNRPEFEETPAAAAPVVETNVTDDSELIAVIAAAIAASEGTTTDGFVVRSINRR